MSHASNKVDWCLKKAKEELSKGEKHRGLAQSQPNAQESRAHLDKADYNLQATIFLSESQFSEWAISTSFYSIYHCFLAIARKFGYESRNQECTIALIRYLKEQNRISLDEGFIIALEVQDTKDRQESSIIEKRELHTYGTSTPIDQKEEIAEIISLCKNCIEQTRGIIYKKEKEIK